MFVTTAHHARCTAAIPFRSSSIVTFLALQGRAKQIKEDAASEGDSTTSSLLLFQHNFEHLSALSPSCPADAC